MPECNTCNMKLNFGGKAPSAVATMARSHPLFVLLFLGIVAPSVAVDTLTPEQPLVGDNQILISESSSFVLGFFRPGSNRRYVGIWYHQSKVSVRTVVRVANREHPITDGTGSLSIAGNGTMYITSGNGIIWSSPSLSLRNPVAQLLDNGNFVVREANNPESYAWQSFHYPTDTMLPGMKVGWDREGGLHRTLVAWKSSNDPSPSDFNAVLDRLDFPQIKVQERSSLFWRAGPWNGLGFSGIPVMQSYSMFSFQFELEPEEVSYMFMPLNASIISHVTMNQSGSLQRLMWIEENKYWKTIWSAPSDQCDTPSFCGPYGVCNPNNDFVCGCPPGFRPANPATWTLGDGSGGCMRNNSLNCRTDGFRLLRRAKLPDTSNSSLDMSLSLEECRQKCSDACSCTGYASANINTGVGCLTWDDDLTDIRVFTNGGQDLYIRLAAADLAKVPDQNHSHKNKVANIAASLASVIGAFTFLTCFICRKLNKREKVFTGEVGMQSNMASSFSKTNKGAVTMDDDQEVDLPIYDFKAICAATENFSYRNLLGEGGFGLVYKGKLAHGQEIAVKRLSRTSIQGINEFKNEVTLIAKLQHRNLVRLLGCSVAGEERILVYEYMPNKSLDALLFEKDKGFNLSWKARYNIITGIARGLLYLHQDSRFRIIHRDLKASNILLDNDLNPKISDFGLARVFSDDDAINKTRKVVGTYGYMSPEYALNGLFSVKSDVFSFGVIVLEIISGARNKGVYHSDPRDYLLGKAWSLWHDGRSLELIDPLIGDEYCVSEVVRCIKVGLLCVQEHPDNRPAMSNVVVMLVSDNKALPEPKEPGFMAKRDDMDSQSSSSYEQDFGSNNYVTLTTHVGR